MKKLIIANWKMNPETYEEAEKLVSAIKAASPQNAEVVLCPPFPWLTDFSHKETTLAFGAQNMFWEDKGAFTGEVSPTMLKSSGVQYVILGHSERRTLFGETDETVNKKIKKALEVGLKVIFCIGETSSERDEGKKQEVLERQIKIGLDEVKDASNIVIAYEPVWAIGTGNSCGVQETKESLDFIRREAHSELKVLYGGSVKGDNAKEYLENAGADGLLVGGASLKPEEFLKIISSAE